MRFHWLPTMGLLCLLSMPAFARDTRHFPLKWQNASGVVKAISRQQLPIGIAKLTPDDKQNELIAEGTPEALDALRKQIALFDVQVPQIKIKCKVLRFDYAPEGTWEVTEIASPEIMTLDSTRCSTSIREGDAQGQPVMETTLTFVPTLLPDGRIAVKGAFTNVHFTPQRTRLLDAAIERTAQPGERVVAGFTHSNDPVVQKQVEAGLLLSDVKTPVTVYYVKWSATVIRQK